MSFCLSHTHPRGDKKTWLKDIGLTITLIKNTILEEFFELITW